MHRKYIADIHVATGSCLVGVQLLYTLSDCQCAQTFSRVDCVTELGNVVYSRLPVAAVTGHVIMVHMPDLYRYLINANLSTQHAS